MQFLCCVVLFMVVIDYISEVVPCKHVLMKNKQCVDQTIALKLLTT